MKDANQYVWTQTLSLLGPYRNGVKVATSAYVLSTSALSHETRAISVTGAGVLKVKLVDASAALTLFFPAGTTKVCVNSIYSTGCTVTGAVALW